MHQDGTARRALLKTGLALAALGGCASARSAPAAQAPPPVTMERRTLTAPDGAAIEADFGKVTVPAVRSDANAGSYELAFVWMRSANGAGRAPIVYLEGGPGASSTWMASHPYGMNHLAPLLAATDVILLDQRGTGSSQPEASWRWDGPPPMQFFVTREGALEHLLEANRRAVAALTAQGMRLDSFTTEEAADDVNDLRLALGLPRISLFGFSYGTHLGLSVLRRHGAHIERAVLVGVEGPDDTLKPPLGMDEAFDRIARLAAADPNVAAAGDLWALLDRVRARLAASPMIVQVTVSEGATAPVPVGPHGLDVILRADIGDASDIPVFPRLLHSIDQGDPSVLQWFVNKRAGWAVGVNMMAMMTDAASGASPQRLALVARQAEQSRFGNVANFPWPEVAAVLSPPPQARDFRTPVRSDAPTLFLAGDLDWNTPPPQAAAAARHFSRAELITVANAGHEQTYPHPEVRAAVTRFLSGERVGGLAPAYPALRFVPLTPGVPGPSHPSVQPA